MQLEKDSDTTYYRSVLVLGENIVFTVLGMGRV